MSATAPDLPIPAIRLPAPREFLPIPGKYLLTDLGEQYCTQKRIPLKELRLHRGSTALGFAWTSINTELLGQFVTHGLMSGLELERTEFLDRRQEILRLTEVIFRGIARRRFRPLLKHNLRGDPLYAKVLEQGHPAEKIRQALGKHEKALAAMRETIRWGLQIRHPQAPVEPLLALVDQTTWLALLQDHNPKDPQGLRTRFLEFLVSYAGRLELSESVSLVLMEFLQQAEKSHFINLAERDLFTRKNPQKVELLLADPRFRERLLEKARQQNELLVLSLDFGGPAENATKGLGVNISVRNRGVVGNQLRKDTLLRRPKTLTQGSIEDFLLEGSEVDLGGMSLWTLETLRDLCDAQGIGLETHLARDERLDETTATLRLVL